MAEGGAEHAFLVRINEESKRRLTQNRVYLISNIKPRPCLTLLKAGGAITTDKFDEIVQLHTREDKVEAILNLLSRGNQGLYDSFIQALKDTKQTAVVTQLREASTSSATAIGGDLPIEKSAGSHPDGALCLPEPLTGTGGNCEGQRFLKAVDPEVSALLTRCDRKPSGEDSEVVVLNVVRYVAEKKLASLVPALEEALLEEEEEKEAEEKKAKTLNLSSCPGGLLPHQMSSMEYYMSASTATRLRLSGNQIGEQGAQHLARGLMENTVLMELELSNNEIGDQGAEQLRRGLESNSTLRELELAHNQIGYQGAYHVGQALQQNTTLRVLGLNSNDIGDLGAQHIAEALNGNTALRTLQLDANEIGDQGALHLGRGLERNKSLMELDLVYNRIGDEGAAHLARSLGVNTTLQTLELSFNQIDDAGASQLAKALRRNQTLERLWLSAETAYGDEEYLDKDMLKSLKDEFGERIDIH